MLDLTLKELYDKTSSSNINLFQVFSNNSILKNLSSRDQLAIIEKLIKDGYAEFKQFDYEYYYITVEGILFLKAKGYCGKRKSDKILKFWNQTKNVFLVIGTISAVVLASLQTYQLYQEINNKAENKALPIKSKSLNQTIPTKDIKPTMEHDPILKK
ncbi:hypothetical protein [Flavobacterium sp.]|uniref:hypothetical protein n=1 Tax=Flavobacterium sp. TaxID=239 RepID=UPI0025C45C4B|nr:hypothetical protein [Flavobacterium sp.]